MFQKISPIGGIKGDLHEFQITQDGTALITMHQETQTPTSSNGLSTSWIYDSVFQEIDIHSGELVFEWHASDHFPVDESKVDKENGRGDSPGNAFDFFHINSIDKGADGNFLVSSQYMGAVACISREDGRVLWQLGGDENDFKDLSHGAATSFTWNSHVSWYGNTTLALFASGLDGDKDTAKHGRGLMIELDLQAMTAALVRSYEPPQTLQGPSEASPRGSVQILPNQNVLVGWGHTPAYTEFSGKGEVRCDTHFVPGWFAHLGEYESYRSFKYNWVGRPNTVPDVAVRPEEDALYVSWNGATEVDEWALQSDSSPDFGRFIDHMTVVKKSFETRISVPRNVKEFVRIVALDANRKIIGYTNVVSKNVRTAHVSPPQSLPLRYARPQTVKSLVLAFFGLVAGIAALHRILRVCRRRFCGRRQTSHQYQHLPTSEKQWAPM